MPFSESHSHLSEEEIKKILPQISSLDQKQKEVVSEVLEKYKGEGLLERYEFEKALKELEAKRIELGLSEIDLENIKKHFKEEKKEE